MTKRNVLLFPATVCEAVPIKSMAVAAGERVIAASSNADEPALQLSEQHTVLRHVLDPEFPAQLRDLIVREKIVHVYAPHKWCYAAVKSVLEAAQLPVTVSYGLPQFHVHTILTDYQRLVTPVLHKLSSIRTRQPVLLPEQMVPFLQLVSHICGQSHFRKLVAMCIIAADLPTGDIVEIGVDLGRSAVLFRLLARHYHIGALVCIDPWHEKSASQGVAVLDAGIRPQDYWEHSYNAFLAAMMPHAGHEVACLRQTSREGHTQYHMQRVLGNPPLGPMLTTGRIACLHIDGNHAYEEAKWDIDNWSAMLMPGAWMIVDDYEWPYGDGPKRAADEWVAANNSRIVEKFVMDRALFLKVSG